MGSTGQQASTGVFEVFGVFGVFGVFFLDQLDFREGAGLGDGYAQLRWRSVCKPIPLRRCSSSDRKETVEPRTGYGLAKNSLPKKKENA